MKHKIIITIIICIIIVVLGGCGKSGTEITTEKQFHEGTEGITWEIFGMPEEVYQDVEFRPSMNIWNKGAYNLEKATLMISVGEDDFCLCEKEDGCKKDNTNCKKVIDKTLEIKGKSVFNPIGDFEIFQFGAKAKPLNKNEKESTQPIVFKTCYVYETEIKEDICIDAQLGTTPIIEKACEVQPLSLTSQGAPVAITNVETKMLPAPNDYIRPEIKITIRNEGGGQVINKDKYSDVCSANKLNAKDWNTISLDEMRLVNDKFRYIRGNNPGNNIECTPNNHDPIRLKDNEISITCIVDSPGIHKSEASFMTQLAIKLSYGYTHTETKKIKILNPKVIEQ